MGQFGEALMKSSIALEYLPLMEVYLLPYKDDNTGYTYKHAPDMDPRQELAERLLLEYKKIHLRRA